MLYFTKNKHECTGCRACEAICLKNSISFNEDSEGFLYPTADSSCINCGMCYKVCPTFNKRYSSSSGFKQFAVGAKHKNEDTWFNSTSGGAFSAICETFHNEEVTIFGAVFDEFKVVHTSVDSVNEIDKFRKSKYVQSDLNASHQTIKALLENNRMVVFSGTPCQVTGLKNYLGKDYEHLFTIDLICHGVGSPRVFRDYIESVETNCKTKVLSYSFRNKRIKRKHINEYVTRIEFENGTIKEDINDLYNKGFLQALFLRPSCGECKFTNIDRVGDLTIADLKKRYDLLPDYNGIENLSAIIVNSQKGLKIYEKLEDSMDIYRIDFDKLVKTNNPLRSPSTMSKNREAFFEELSSGQNIEDALGKYVVSPSLKIRLWSLIPDKTRSKLRRKVKWIKKLQ